MPKQRRNKKPIGYLVHFPRDLGFIFLRVSSEREARAQMKDKPLFKLGHGETLRFEPRFRDNGR